MAADLERGGDPRGLFSKEWCVQAQSCGKGRVPYLGTERTTTKWPIQKHGPTAPASQGGIPKLVSGPGKE